VVARLVLVGGYEALPDLAFPSVQSRANLENEDEGVESLISLLVLEGIRLICR